MTIENDYGFKEIKVKRSGSRFQGSAYDLTVIDKKNNEIYFDINDEELQELGLQILICLNDNGLLDLLADRLETEAGVKIGV